MKEIMEKRGPRKRVPAAQVAVETPRRAQLDNIDLDMRDAHRLGYGCHYGAFKADHPYTKTANEARLEAAQVPQGKVYEFTCRGCGEKFTTTNRMRRYCGDDCKIKKESAVYRAKYKKREAQKRD